MDRSELLNRINPEWRDAFLRFVETGEADDAFEEYINGNQAAQEAVEAAFAGQASAFRELAQSISSEPTTAPLPHASTAAGRPISQRTRRLITLSSYVGVPAVIVSIALGFLVARLSQSVTETEGRLAIAERERHELQIASRHESQNHKAEVASLEIQLDAAKAALQRTGLGAQALAADTRRLAALQHERNDLSQQLDATRSMLQGANSVITSLRGSLTAEKETQTRTAQQLAELRSQLAAFRQSMSVFKSGHQEAAWGSKRMPSTVVAKLFVKEDGTIGSSDVLSSGPGVDTKALVDNIKCEPVTYRGKPVPTWITFSLPARPADSALQKTAKEQ